MIILCARAYVSTRADPLRGRCLLWRNSQQQPLTAHEKVLCQGEPRPLGEWRRVVTHSQKGSNCPSCQDSSHLYLSLLCVSLWKGKDVVLQR